MKYQIKIETEAGLDIQDAISWYNSQQQGLGHKFYAEIKEFLKSLEFNPLYEIRYDKVRCLSLKTFPYTLHFTVNETDRIVVLRAVFHVSRNPDSWKKN